MRILRTLSLYGALRDLVRQIDMIPIPLPPNVLSAMTMARIALQEEESSGQLTWLTMVRLHREIHGDPYRPWESMTDYKRQATEVKCFGCDAVGESRWPEWEQKIEHKPGCAWLAWKELLDGNETG